MQRIRGVSGPILGHYRIAVNTGAMVGLGAGATIFAARWATTALVRAAITRLRCRGVLTVPFTAGQEYGALGLLASAYTASATGGSTAIPTAGQQSTLQVVEAALPSQFTDIRVSGASGLTPGTRTLDAQSFINCGSAQLLAAAAAQQGPPCEMDWNTDSDQRMPIIMQGGGPVGHGSATNVPANAQGFEIVNNIGFGAAGAVRWFIEMEWLEYGSDSAEGMG